MNTNVFARYEVYGNNSKFCLIGKIKGLAVEARRARVRLLKSKSDKVVWSLSHRKRLVGIDTRHHLLAYAFLRGDAYLLLEKRCREDNKPKSKLILEIVQQHVPEYEIKNGWWSLEKIENWLKGE